ncbi:substrate-binding domain-containing protein [Halovulum sp. GXIMD14793]
MTSPYRVLAIAAIAAIFSATASAAPVTLRAKNGSASLEGELVDFDGQNYKIKSGLGVATIPAADVDCIGEACPQNGGTLSIGIFASDTSASLALPQILAAYGQSFGGTVQVPEAGGQSGGGDALASGEIADLISGRADIILSSRRINLAEAQQLVPGGMQDIQNQGLEYVLASEGMVVVADPTLQIETITLDQLAGIYSGKIRNWNELGGPNMPITAFMREIGSASRDAFGDLVLTPAGLAFADGVIGVDNDTGVAASVVAFPGAVGITGLAAAGTSKTLAIKDKCGIATLATPFAVQTGQYPLTRHLYAYRGPKTDPGFIDGMVRFLESKDGRTALHNMGLVDHGILRQDDRSQGARLVAAMSEAAESSGQSALQNMVKTLSEAKRLSPTFRPNKADGYDAMEFASLKTLAKAIMEGEFDGQEVLFIGFTDPTEGDAQGNLIRSRGMASRVQNSLIELSPSLRGNKRVTFRAIGYGGISPLACSESGTGRDLNRRVEIWVRTARN